MKTRRLSPRFELAHAMRVAARNINDAECRRIAARNAIAILRLYPERFDKGWGAMASRGRAMMRSLPDLPADQRADTAKLLRECADVVQHGSFIVSETSLGDRRREQRRA